MKRYLIIACSIAFFVIISFLAVEAMGFAFVSDPSTVILRGGLLAAMISCGLLLGDVILPVPSSLVMIANGAVFGVISGFLLSLVSWVGGSMIGWWMGRKCRKWVEGKISESERRAAVRLFEKYGLAAIAISRMLPVLSETISIMSGIVGMRSWHVLIAATLGSIPPSLIYAIAGAYSSDFASGSLIAFFVFLLAGVCWWISRRLIHQKTVLPQYE